jgi:small subunit ribosomal protein S17
MTEEPDVTEDTEDQAAPAEAAPETEATPEAEAAPEAEEAPAEAEEKLSPKERRGRKRSVHTGEARPAMTPEERNAARLERRAQNAASRRRWRASRREKRRAQPSGEGTPRAERTGTGRPRERQGVVISDKGDKTISVRIDIARQHRTYGKIVRTSSTLHAHDERNEANAGDTVKVVESRPLSRTKRWRLVEVVERAR